MGEGGATMNHVCGSWLLPSPPLPPSDRVAVVVCACVCGGGGGVIVRVRVWWWWRGGVCAVGGGSVVRCVAMTAAREARAGTYVRHAQHAQ